ncbi:MAG: beta-galactosidase [Ruminococcaceae bacterium]|nr:beta-galactosidase [Oscillospiraceae bacterium]
MSFAKLEITKNGFTFDGKPFYIASGDMHYFRFFKNGWRRRLQLMKDFGLTCVQTYVPWNLHEPEEGDFHFEDNLDIAAFLELCDEIGLKVLLRPSPYICSEWDLGGLPYWLLKKEGIGIRTTDPIYMECVTNYYKQLIPKIVPYLSTNGGPVIAVAVENEYGSFCDDNDYIKALGDMLVELGVDVPLFTANGYEPFKMQAGSRPEYLTGLDIRQLTDEAKTNITAYQPEKPIYIAELWCGRSHQWGGYFVRQTPEAVAEKYKTILEKGAYINIYMFCGGSNFGFMNGALVGKYKGGKVEEFPWEQSTKYAYIPFATSYDVDAPISEQGDVTPKYYTCKKVLKEYMESHGFEFGGTDDFVYESKVQTQQIKGVKLDKSADLLDNAENIAKTVRRSGMPLTFETMDQPYGFMLYSSNIRYTDDTIRQLVINGLHDYALVFGNGEYLGTYMRDRECEPIRFYIPKEGMKLDILVENMGRVNSGHDMIFEKKGILGYVKIDLLKEDGTRYGANFSLVGNWKNYSLPMSGEDIEKLDYSLASKQNRPAVFTGSFDAKTGVDTFVNTNGWTKGVVYVNGFNLGRYWAVGPVESLYVPGEIVKEHNTVSVLELYSPSEGVTVDFDVHPSLDGADGGEFARSIKHLERDGQVG